MHHRITACNYSGSPYMPTYTQVQKPLWSIKTLTSYGRKLGQFHNLDSMGVVMLGKHQVVINAPHFLSHQNFTKL